MVDLDLAKLLAKGLTPLDVANAVNAQYLTLPSGTAKIGDSADHENPHLTLRWTRRNPPSQSL
jgi:multidrug efflux pump subunit AcrB